MITKHDLECAIAECQGDPNPNAQTCMKLASYFTISDHLFEKPKEAELITEPEGYSMEPGVVTYSGDSEFAQAIKGKDLNDVLPLIDELMQTASVLMPALYKSVMRRL